MIIEKILVTDVVAVEILVEEEVEEVEEVISYFFITDINFISCDSILNASFSLGRFNNSSNDGGDWYNKRDNDSWNNNNNNEDDSFSRQSNFEGMYIKYINKFE